ncbi:uncharacterized protein I303_105390 [Kwoniella dejecticola CBS 10117]|uniref:Sister chromatid cohesion protein DCC1 n=1 Tax=Kwoniella dejecticola CBS 10117 TaxID=1296121 RepID=A0A1A6A2M2_9TREE|nr:sister chromatid cohesion protein DCC1 [Kwoniella dejecticola CBS 10117]OBR84307.1 sister chromatid cohesion protein DCC1 [Kwoniella dejecticola CBS 10117]
MPVGSSLPQRSVVLRYPPATTSFINATGREGEGEAESEESYQLLELAPEIIKAVEASRSRLTSDSTTDKKDASIYPLTIKGKPSDDAVLCTPDSTFLLRTVGISNSILVCRTPSSSAANLDSIAESRSDTVKPTLQIRDTCHEILECVPISPNLERIRTILKESAWKGINSSSASLGKRKRGDAKEKKVKRWTRDQLNSVIQASDEELERGLRDRNVIEVDGKMLLLPPKELKELLSIILSLLTIHNTGPSTPNIAPSRQLISSLEDDHEVSPAITERVLRLFGHISPDQDENGLNWKCDIKRIVKCIGNGLLLGVREKKLDEFEREWKEEVGEEFGDEVDIKLLEGEYLISPAPMTSLTFSSPSPLITHFSLASLPLQPAQRFADLFLTRQKWSPEDILPFLKGLTRDGDVKARDKLVAKFVRVVKEKDGVWWYPRRSS